MYIYTHAYARARLFTQKNMFVKIFRKMSNSRNEGYIVAEFYDGIQVIPKTWLQSENLCKYPSHYKTDSRIRKTIEKDELPTSNWTSFKVVRIFGEYCKYLSKITFNFFLIILANNISNIFSVLT